MATKQKSPETGTSPERRKRLNKLATAVGTVAATLALSISATGIANKELNKSTPMPHDNTTELPAGHSITLESKDSAGLYDVIPSDDIRFLLPGLMRKIQLSETEPRTITQILEKPSETIRTVHATHEEKLQGMKFARTFGEKNPESEIQARGEDSTRAMAEWITEMQDQGWEVDGVTIVSTASAESHLNVGDDNNPGLGIKDPENERLAILRGEFGKEKLLNDITKESDAKNAKSIGKLVTIKGKEIEDKKLNSDIFKLSEELHIAADDLIMMYNTGENLPELADEILDRLADDRYVLYKVEMSKDIIIEGPSNQIVTTETVNVTRETQIVYIIVPAFIPVPRGWKKVVKPPVTDTPKVKRQIAKDDDRKYSQHTRQVYTPLREPGTSNNSRRNGNTSGSSDAFQGKSSHRGQKRG